MTQPTHQTDLTQDELIKRINAVLAANPDAEVFVKWTCPQCGERVTADTPNTFRLGGYVHAEKSDGSRCGCLYKGPFWGFAMLVKLSRE